MKPKYNTAKFRSQTLGASLVTSIVVCLSGSAFAADNFWTGTTSTDWNDATNWSLGSVPTNPDDAVVNVKTPNIATITTNPTSGPRDFRVGQGGGADGQLNQISGSATTGGGNWAFVGRNGGTGVFNLADTTGSGGVSTGFAQGSGSFTCNGSRLYVGGGNDGATGGNGTFNMNTSGTLTIGNDLAIGVSTGAVGVMNVDNGTITTGGWNFIGKNENGQGGNGTLRMTGGLLTNTGITYVGQQGCVGTMILSGGTYKHLNNEVFMVGGTIDWADWFGNVGGTGFLTVDNSASLLDCPGEFWIGNRGGNGTMTLSAGTVVTNNWTVIGRGGNGGGGVTQGTVNMSGGTFTKNGGGNFIIGDNATGVLNISGGALSANGEYWVGQAGGGNGTMTLGGVGSTVSTNGWMVIGRDGGTGTVTMTGGTWTHSGNTQFIVGSTGPGSMTMSGGLVDVQTGYTFVGERSNSPTASLTISGGEFRSRFISVGPESPNATLNLNGGTVRTHKFVGSRNENDGEEYGTSTINFNGSQIIATAADAAFISSTVDNAVVGTGGLLVNSNGYNLIVPKVLSGTGGVVKSGAGKLTLNGSNSYNGGNTVNAGELALKASSTGGGALTLANGTTLSLTAQFAGGQLPSSDGTFGTSDTVNLNLGDVAGSNPITAILDFTGNLVLNGNVTLNVAGSKFQAAPMPLVSYVPGQKSGAGNFVLGTLPAGVVATLVDDTVNGLVYLDITSVALPEWDGTNVAKYVKTGDVTSGLFDVVVTDATNIAIGQKAIGAGIPTGALVTAISGLTITLDQAATATSFGIPVRFTIGTGSNDGVWDVNTTQNWVDQVTANLSVYKDPNPVLFSDLATGPTAVTLDSTANPSEVVFNNSTLAYSLVGTGKISGSATLTKSGTQSLSIDTNNDYTGVTTLAGGNTNVGTLTSAGVASPLGAASSAASNLVLSGGTLNYTGATVAIDRGFTTGGLDGAISVPSGADLTMSGAVTGGLVSSFNKKGDGSLILTNSSVTLGASGQVNEVLAGTLKLSGPGQTVSVPGELWVGSVPAAPGHLVLDNTSLTVGSWLTLGRGNGDTGLLSTITATGSTVVCGAFSTGYDNGLPNNSDQTVTLANTNWTSNGATVLAERANALTNMTLSGTSVFTANAQFQMATNGTAEAHVVIQDNAGLVHTSGWLSIGNDGVGTMTVKDSGTINSSGDFNVGDVASANGTLNLQNNASVISTGNVFIGKNGTTGTINMIGASTMTSPDTNVGGGGSSNGSLNIGGTSVFTSNGRLQVGPGGGSTGNVLIEGSGSLVVNSYVSVGFDGGGSMTVKDGGSFSNNDDFSVNENGDVPANVTLQDTGTITVGGTTFVGRNGGKVGTLTQTGGTYTGNGGEFQIGRSGTGTWLQSGGVTNAGGWVAIGRLGGSTGLLTVSGTGTFNQTGAGNALIVGEEGTGTLTIQGTATVSSAGSNGVMVANNSAAIGTVNLDGGTLIAKKVVEGTGGTSTFNFNGGVLKAATGADLNFMAGLDAANVNPGGAFIDSNGETIAINLSLNDGNGGLTKQGAGTLLLNGANTYLGTTTVTAGTLGGTGSVGGELIVPAGTSIAPGASGAGTFTVEDTFGNGSTIGGTYVCQIDGAAADNLAVGGALDISGATLDINELSAPGATVFVIASYGSLSGPFATVLDLPSGYTLDYNYLGGNQIALVQTATPYSTWAGSFGLDPFTDGAPEADPDSDGQANSVEFALGGDPTSGSDNAKVFNLAADSDADGDSTNELLLTIAVRSGTPAFVGSPSPSATQDGFTYTIEGSTTLDTFTTTVTPVTTVAPPAPNATPPAGYEYRTFSLSGSNGLPDKGFLRVKVTN